MKKQLLLLLVVLMALPTLAQQLKSQKDSKNDLYGFVDQSGKWVIKPTYEEVSEFYTIPNGRQIAFVKIKGKEGLIDNQGKYIIKPEYNSISGYLDGDVFLAEDNKNTEVFNDEGKRRYKFDGYTGIRAIESDDKGALFMMLPNGKWRIYTKDIQTVNKIDTNFDTIGDFMRINFSLDKDAYYTNADRVSLKPYLTNSDKFRNAKGEETNFTGGKMLRGDSIYYMTTSKEGPYCVFKIGETEPLGITMKEPLDRVVKLDNGKYINRNGDPVEVIRSTRLYSGEPRAEAYKNLRTGKYGILEANNLEEKVGVPVKDKYAITPEEHELFDYVAVSNAYKTDKGDSFGILAIRDGEIFILNENRHISTRSKGSVDIKRWDNGYTTFVNNKGKIGLKKDGKVLIENEYDGIFPLGVYYYNGNTSSLTDYYKLYKDGKCALYNIKTGQIVIPLEKGYTSVGGDVKTLNVRAELFDAGLIYTQVGEDNDPDKMNGLWSLTAGKEVIPPLKGNRISHLPAGYDGYMYNGVAYTPQGKVMKLAPAVDVYQCEWANDAPYYLVKFAGLKGRTVEFQLTVYNENGSVYVGRDGKKCIYTFSQTATPETEIEYGPEVTFYLGDDIYIPPYTKKTLKFVLSARDAKTKAAIPVKGEKSYSRWYERKW